MRPIVKRLSVGLLALLTLCALTAAADTPEVDADSLIREVDRLYRAENSYTELEMEIITPHWQRTLAMYGWSEGMDKTFIRITAPRKEKVAVPGKLHRVVETRFTGRCWFPGFECVHQSPVQVPQLDCSVESCSGEQVPFLAQVQPPD